MLFLPFSAFNNIWSNIGYVALGLLFIMLALRRQQKYKTLEEVNMEKDADQYKAGVPQHFGIYYTIGRVLIINLSVVGHSCGPFLLQ